MTPEQRAALLVLREQIAEQIDGDSPTDSRYTDWVALANIALGYGADPWHYMTLAPDIKAMKATFVRKHDIDNGECRAIYDPDAACSCPLVAPSIKEQMGKV